MPHDSGDETKQGFGIIELDGAHPPDGRYLLHIDEQPTGWIRSDPDPDMEYLSVNELVSQNNLRLAEFYAEIVAHGGDITAIGAHSVQDCLKDARHAFYVAQAVRMCEMTAIPRIENPAISFAELRKAQGVKNRHAFSTPGNVVELKVHLADEALQRDAVEWLRSTNKPLPVPAPPEGTLALPGEFTKFPLFPNRDQDTAAAPYSTLCGPSYTSPVKTTGPRHKRNKPSMHCSGPAVKTDLDALAYPPFSTLTPQQRAARDAKKVSEDPGLTNDSKKYGDSGGGGGIGGPRSGDGGPQTPSRWPTLTPRRGVDTKNTGMFGGDGAMDTVFEDDGPQTPSHIVDAEKTGMLGGDAAMPIFHGGGHQTPGRAINAQKDRMSGGGSVEEMPVFYGVGPQTPKRILDAMAMQTSNIVGTQTPSSKRRSTPTMKYMSSDQFNLAVANAQLPKGATKFRTWADLKDHIPDGIQIPQLEQRIGLSPRQKGWLENHRTISPKKPYVPLAERVESPSQEEKMPNHVRLARARDGGFSPKKKLDTERMPNLFTPKKDRTYPGWAKNSVEQQRVLGISGGPSSPPKKFSQDGMADYFSPDGAEDKFSMSPRKFFTHQRTYGLSKSSPPPGSPQSISVDPTQKANHTREGALDYAEPTRPDKCFNFNSKISFAKNAGDNRSSYGSFKYDQEQEDALMAGGFILSPPPVPEKSSLRNLQPGQCSGSPPKLRRTEGSRKTSPEGTSFDSPRSPPKLRRTESSRTLSPERKSADGIGRRLGRDIESTRELSLMKNLSSTKNLFQIKKSSTDTIKHQEGRGLTKSFTSYDLSMLAAETSLMPRSETVPDNLQEASANVFDDVPCMPNAPALPAVGAAVGPVVGQMSPIKEAAKATELDYRDTLQLNDKVELSEASETSPQPDSPSKMMKAVNSMAMFRSSFWNKDEAVSKKTVIATASNPEKDTAQAEQKKQFEEKKPFIKTKWFNLKVMIGKKTKPTPSRFQVSCDTTFQLRLYSDLELLLITVANRYLNDEYDAGRISRSQASKCVHKWVGMGRAQFTEWNAGQLYQSQYIWEFRDQLIFFGTYNKIQRDATLSTWSINAKEMSVRSGCNGDSQIQKHFMDSWKVLELLGGSLDEFLHMSRLHVSFHDMVAKKKADNDAKGIKHEWDPAPIPKTPAPGALVRTPMLE